MAFASRTVLASRERYRKACLSIYCKAIQKKPGRDHANYLKLVLLNTPPYDTFEDAEIEAILEHCTTIEELIEMMTKRNELETSASMAGATLTPEPAADRLPELKQRNETFNQDFWA